MIEVFREDTVALGGKIIKATNGRDFMVLDGVVFLLRDKSEFPNAETIPVSP